MVGGGFTQFEGEPRARLAQVTKAGRLDPLFQAEVKYRVDAIAALPDGRWILGGEFNTVNGVRMNHVAVVGADGRLDPGFAFEEGDRKSVV